MPFRHDLKGSSASWEACHGLLSVKHVLACVGAVHKHGTERVVVSGPAVAAAPVGAWLAWLCSVSIQDGTPWQPKGLLGQMLWLLRA